MEEEEISRRHAEEATQDLETVTEDEGKSPNRVILPRAPTSPRPCRRCLSFFPRVQVPHALLLPISGTISFNNLVMSQKRVIAAVPPPALQARLHAHCCFYFFLRKQALF